MYSKMRIYPFIEDFCHKAIVEDNYESRLQKLRNLLDHSDYVVIGAGAGLSDAAGIAYSGKRFTDNFTDFIARYGLTDMYSSAFYPFKTEEERWAYWARHILMNRYDMPATELYRLLFNVIKDKNYFVITTNVDGQFEKSGFECKRIFAVQGDYATCNVPMDAMTSFTTMKTLSGRWHNRQRIVAFPPGLFPVVRYAVGKWMYMYGKTVILCRITNGTQAMNAIRTIWKRLAMAIRFCWNSA